MLTAAQRDIVKSTVPLLETGGEALTTHFYQLLFREHPEVRPYFNQAHQAAGTQPRALANSVLQYARHIDNLAGLGNLPAQIINKHVSLQVAPAHYPAVGACLLQAIREVLGAEIATDAVIAAWGAAYQQLADILIGAEEDVYAKSAAATGGWRGLRKFRIRERRRESAEIASFHLAPEDGKPVLKALPGQYLGLRLDINGEEHRRNYSLSAACDGIGYRISVKREGSGTVSRFLHDRVLVGDTVEVMPPAGEFVLLDGAGPLALIGGGVGVTPLMAMLEAAAPSGRAIEFIHASRSREVQAFRPAVEALVAQYPNVRAHFCFEQGTANSDREAIGLLDEALLRAWLPPSLGSLEAYFVGPPAFMATVKQALEGLGVPAPRLHWEFFGPAEALG